MPDTQTVQLDRVNIKLKANVYFDGKVVSHTILTSDGARKTVGVIYPGSYKFNTDAPEAMEIIAGNCRVKLAGQESWKVCEAGGSFRVAGHSPFEIAVDQGLCEYLCSFE